jgi:hypothetical protein
MSEKLPENAFLDFYVATECFNFADAWIEARNKKEGA